MVRLIRSICTCICSAVKMKFTIVATVLLGLLLTPALAQYFQNVKGVNKLFHKRINIGIGYQTLTIDSERLVAIIEDRSNQQAWKTVWNYDTGFIASKLLSQNVCYISRMDTLVMPALNSIAVLAEESQAVKGERVVTKSVRYIISDRRIRDLQSYGPEIYSLCRGLSTYLAYDVQQQQSLQQPLLQQPSLQQPLLQQPSLQQQQSLQQGPQVWYNPNSCYRLDVLNLLGIDYCQAGSV